MDDSFRSFFDIHIYICSIENDEGKERKEKEIAYSM